MTKFANADNFYKADSLQSDILLQYLDESSDHETGSPHRHNYYELFYFTKGGGSHLIDFVEFSIQKNSIHIVPPGALHQVKREAGSSGYVVLFTKAFLYSLDDFTPARHFRIWRQKPQYPLNDDEATFVQMSIHQMRDEISSDRPYQHRVMTSLLQMIFILMFRHSPHEDMENRSLAEDFFELLEETFTSELGPTDMAKELNCSLKTLNRALKAGGYSSPRACITERKILEARRLLIHTQWSVKEIAYHLSFSDPDYFGKVFKAETGLTPTDIRK